MLAARATNFYNTIICSKDDFCSKGRCARNAGGDMEYISLNASISVYYMDYFILLYSNRRIYCDAGCIYGCFLDMDIEAEEGDCNVLYSMACPLCIVNLYVLEVGRSISCNDDCVIKVLGFAISRLLVLYAWTRRKPAPSMRNCE